MLGAVLAIAAGRLCVAAAGLGNRDDVPVEHATPEYVPAPRVIRARQLVTAAGGSAATTGWLALLGLVTTPYMLHELGTAAYGVFALVTIVSGYLSNLEFGFGHALVRFLARAHGMEDRVQERRVLETSLAVFLPAGARRSSRRLPAGAHRGRERSPTSPSLFATKPCPR